MPISRRFRPKTRRIMTTIFVVTFLILLVIPFQRPAMLGCEDPKQRGGRKDGATPTPTSPQSNGATSDANAPTPRLIVVPNAPIASLVHRLLPEQRVVIAGAAHATEATQWKPTALEISALQQASLIVLNGAGYEPWSEQAALPRAQTLELATLVRDRLIAMEEATHTHGPEGAHSHGATAATTWLSPEILRTQSRVLALALIERAPVKKDAIESNLASIERQLTTINDTLREVALVQPNWLASHPVYQYLAQSGGLTIHSMHWEPDAMPDETQWTALQDLRSKHPSLGVSGKSLMLFEGEPIQALRERLEREQIEIVVFMPLGVTNAAAPTPPADFLAYFNASVNAMLGAAKSL